MAATGQKLIPLSGMNLDVAPQYLKATQAKFIKNLYYQLSDLGDAGTDQGANTGVLKPLPSNELYCPIELPEGDNHVIGCYPSRETNELYVWCYNSLSNHCIFRINGLTATADVGSANPCFGFRLVPEYFIGEGQAYLEVIYLTDTDTGEQIIKKDLFWTNGIDYQGYLRFEDYLETNGFDATQFNYFDGNYDRCSMVRMGLPTPNDCIQIDQVPFNPATDTGKNNNLKSTTWQFRITNIDVFGRPSEHGLISDLFFLSNNECLGSSDMLSRCVNLIFDAGNPLIDKIQVEYRNCNDEQWYLDSVLELYQGSNLGAWWLRPRSTDIVFNRTTNKITYTFCKDKLCDPIPTTETNRTENALARSSQALTKIGRDIATANDKNGFPALSRKDILDKISVEVIKPQPSTLGVTANITIYIRIYNPFKFTYQKVWKKDNVYVFGGIDQNKGIDNIITDYAQNFASDGQQGYIGYLAGTNNYAVGVQYYLDGGNFVKDTDFTENLDKQYFLKFEYTGVPKSNYIFRLAGHNDNPTSIDIRTTSTYVGGLWNFANKTVGTQRTYFKELSINACDIDYDSLTSGEILLAYDMSRPTYNGVLNTTMSDDTVLSGYIYETQNQLTEAYEIPVELLQLDVLHTGAHSFEYSVITDHNGFYFAGSIANPFTVTAKGYCSCIKKELIRGESGFNFRLYTKNMVLGETSRDGFTSSCPDFETLPCSRVLIKGKVQLCGVGTGVPNINVVYAKGGLAITDSNGDFTLIAHDNSVTGFRSDELLVMGGSCAFTDCDGTCIDLKLISFSACTSCIERIVDAGTHSVLFISSKGLLSNGRYGVSLTGYDWLGRHDFSQTTDNLYFNIPSLNETKTFGFSTVNVIIPPDVTFPDWVDYFTIGVTVELNYGGNYIEWIADKVQFVDNSGNENNAAPTQIKIWYASLNEYNSKNNFNTTTGWQIIPTSDTQPRTADIVQFIRNGDGNFFPNPISALVKYDQSGQYFLINYTGSLKDLKENALIRLANPQECANKDSFFELCGKYKVINGKAQQNLITLNAFDTYYQYRQIPVPISLENGDTENDIIELRQFGFPFESPSVTDFWGNKCWNIGRFNVRNPYEAEIINLNQVSLSGALSVNAQLNYLNYFDDSKKITFNINTTGGIVYMRVKVGLVLFICQFKNFIVGYGDNIARLNSENIIAVPSGEDTFGKPERSYSGNFGCQLFDKSTIREIEIEGQAYCQFLDRNKVSILQNDFQDTRDVSRYNPGNSTIVTWLTAKIKYQQQFNLDHGNTRYFHAAINPLNFEWILSEFTIGLNNYVNDERETNVTMQETIGFDILNKVWKAFYSPTPEYNSFLQGANAGQLLFSFIGGRPYTYTGKTFNNFFGIQCGKAYRLIFNTDGFKKKKFQAIEVYCPQTLYFADLILTESNQQSRLLLSRWRKALYFWMADFLCNVKDATKENNITESDNLEGTWIDVRLIGNPANDGDYSEFYGVIVRAVGQEETG